jgi:photosystem II stability/assembly factor-like uncharacterized protein
VVMTLVCLNFPVANAKNAAGEWTSPTTSNLNSVYMLNATEGWAVGDRGTIIHWDGAS